MKSVVYCIIYIDFENNKFNYGASIENCYLIKLQVLKDIIGIVMMNKKSRTNNYPLLYIDKKEAKEKEWFLGKKGWLGVDDLSIWIYRFSILS